MTQLTDVADILATLDRMTEIADIDARKADEDDCLQIAEFWTGWAEGLRTLKSHIRSGMKVTCFPAGSCTCHPFNVTRTKYRSLY